MSTSKIGLSLAFAMLLTGATAYAEDQITVQKSVIDTLRYAPRLEMIKQNRHAVEQDLEKSRGRWYPKIDVRGGYGVDSFHDGLDNGNDYSEDWHERSELGGYLTQRLYDGGEASSQIRLDESRLESLQYRVFDNAESLALDAIIASLEVYRQRELLFPGRRERQGPQGHPGIPQGT